MDRLTVTCCQSGAGAEVIEVNDGFPSQFRKHSVLKRVKLIISSKVPKDLIKFASVRLTSSPWRDILSKALPVSIELFWTLIYVIAVSVWSHLSNSREFYTN